MAQSKSTNSGGSILGLLGVLFVGLKLTGYIGWSWWWVTAPYWGGLALLLTVWLLIILSVGVVALFTR